MRITHGCELVPAGIYKVNDENPKVIEYEDEVKIAEFESLNSLEGWVHKNEMVLNVLAYLFSWEDVATMLI